MLPNLCNEARIMIPKQDKKSHVKKPTATNLSCTLMQESQQKLNKLN